jgi:hypothetical protein
MRCPFCAQENPEQALVCSSCARDITVPLSLIAERDDLIQKCDKVRDELSWAKAQVVEFKRARTRRPAGRDEHGN